MTNFNQEKKKHSTEPRQRQAGTEPMPAINVNIANQNVQQQSTVVGGGLGGRQVSTNLTIMEVVGHFIIWAVICFFTLGIGLVFWPYSFLKLVLNSIRVGNQRVRCELDLGKQIGHIIVWAILIPITLGLATPFYVIGVIRTAVNASRLV